MKQKKTILTLAIGLLMILSLVAVIPMATAIPNPCSVRGYVYVNDVIKKPDQVVLSFPGQDITAILFDDPYGFYTADAEEEVGATGVFYVTIPGGTWEAAENVTIENGKAIYYPVNLTINTSLPPVNVAPTADAGGPYNGVAGKSVTFDGSGSSDSDGTIVSYDWDYGDGNTGTGVNPSHAYTTAGTYTVNLTVTDNNGATGTDSTTAQITKPGGDGDGDGDGDSGTGTGGVTSVTADFSWEQQEGLAVEFTDKSTGPVASWLWDFGDGSTSTEQNPTHTYTGFGLITYDVTLMVSSNTDEDSYTEEIEIFVGNNPPTKPILEGDNTGTKNADYTYTATSTDPDNHSISYTFDWGDEIDTTSDFLANGTSYSTTHSWASAGKYEIWVEAIDDYDNGNGTPSGKTYMTVLIDAINVKELGYMTDNDPDGTYDTFHGTDAETAVEKQTDGTYLIDNDGDGNWDYVYDIETDTLTEYSGEPTPEPDNTALIVLAIIVILFLIILGYLVKRSNDKKKAQKKAAEKKSQPKNKTTSKKSKK